jgi:hypothetical protein
MNRRAATARRTRSGDSRPRATAILTMTLVTAVIPSLLLASAVLVPQGGPISDSRWPTGLSRLVNARNRVFAIDGGPPPGHCACYFAGTQADCSAFLAKWAGLKDASLVLVIHPGRGKTGYTVSEGNKVLKHASAAYDWGLSIAGPFTSECKWGPEHKETWLMTVDLYLGAKIELQKLKVPTNVEVRSGGEIEQFVAAHKVHQPAQ